MYPLAPSFPISRSVLPPSRLNGDMLLNAIPVPVLLVLTSLPPHGRYCSSPRLRDLASLSVSSQLKLGCLVPALLLHPV